MDADVERELAATVAARRELGPEHDEHLAQRFLERIESEIDRRVDARLAGRAARPVSRHVGPSPVQLALCIPILGVAGGIGHLAGIIAALIALVLVFGLAYRSR